MRKWIPQLPRRNNCGQIAVAVLTGISVKEATKLIGKKGCTRTKDLVVALRKLGYSCPDQCRKMARPSLGLAKLHLPKQTGWHWIVVDGSAIYDGVNGDVNGFVRWESNWKITSYLPVTEPYV
jgi:hypothetical protein